MLSRKMKPPSKRASPGPLVRKDLKAKVVSFGKYVAFASEVDTPNTATRHAEQLIQNIALVEDVLKKGDSVLLDFDLTEYLSIEALAYLLGNIEILRHRYGNKINGTYSQHEGVNQLLRGSGFLKRLNYSDKQTSVSPHFDSLKHLTFRASHYLDAEVISPLRKEVTDNNIQLPGIQEKQIFRALSEAMLNVHHHAYAGVKYKLEKNRFLRGKWWLGAQYNESNGVLNFAMYDVGQGIPATMPRNYDGAYLRSFASISERCTDADLIYAATRPGKTSTDKKNRGRGLPDMHQIVENGRGELRIYSGYGRYFFDGVSGYRSPLNSSCLGTLALWSIYTNGIAKDVS